MKTRSISFKSLDILQLILIINFNDSVIFLLIVSVLSISGSELFFGDNSDLYGPLANNIRIVLLYICIMQLSVYGLYQMSGNYGAVFSLGAFLLVLIVALNIYSEMNQVEVDENYNLVFLYVGLSHLLYGVMRVWRKNDN